MLACTNHRLIIGHFLELSYILAEIWLSIFKRFEKYTIRFYGKTKLNRLLFQSIHFETYSTRGTYLCFFDHGAINSDDYRRLCITFSASLSSKKFRPVKSALASSNPSSWSAWCKNNEKLHAFHWNTLYFFHQLIFLENLIDYREFHSSWQCNESKVKERAIGKITKPISFL